MKKRVFQSIVILALTGAIACQPEEFTLSGLPKLPPQVASFAVDGVIIPNVPSDLKVTVNATEANPVASVSMELVNKATLESIASTTIAAGATTSGQVVFTWTDAESGVSGLPPGDYLLYATASNSNGESRSQTQFTILGLDPSCQVVGMVTVVLYTPQSIPADVEVGAVGSFAGSGWGTDFIMTPLGNGYYCVALPLTGTDEFKFRIGQSWGTEEKTSGCGGAPNRAAPGGNWGNVTLQTVPKWGGYGC